MTTDLVELERLARAATTLNLDTAILSEECETECPLCEGAGIVNAKTQTNFDGHATGVQFFGVGDHHKVLEAFVRAAHPQAILDLISTIKLAVNALEEAEAILGGEYGDHYGVLCEQMFNLRDALSPTQPKSGTQDVNT